MDEAKTPDATVFTVFSASDLPGEMVDMFLSLIKEVEENKKILRLLTGALVVAAQRGPIIAPRRDADISALADMLDYYMSVDGKSVTWITRPDPSAKGTKARSDPYAVVTEALIEQAAIVATYEYDTVGLKGKPMKLSAILKPSSGVLLMAKAHWEGLSDKRKESQLAFARSYLMEAVTLGAWPK